MAKQDDYVRYTIRVPAPLYGRIQDAAGEKSVNAEIVDALMESYPAPLNMREVAAKASTIIQRLKKRPSAMDVAELHNMLVDAEYALSQIEKLTDEDHDPRG